VVDSGPAGARGSRRSSSSRRGARRRSGRYGDTAELAATIIEEGENSPARHSSYAQTPGLWGTGRRGPPDRLPDEVLDRVPARFRADDGDWVGTSGRARVVAYNTEELSEGDLPTTSSTSPTPSGRAGSAGPRPTAPSRPS
jgi:iron(III) transport system substrate-binding protein